MTLRYKLTRTQASELQQLRPPPTPQPSHKCGTQGKGEGQNNPVQVQPLSGKLSSEFCFSLVGKKVPGCRCHSFSEKFDLRYNNIQLERNK